MHFLEENDHKTADSNSIMAPRVLEDSLLQEPLLPQNDSNPPISTSRSTASTTAVDNEDHKNIHFSTPTFCGLLRKRQYSMNHNVFLNLVLCVLYGVSDSLWSGTVIAAYLKKLGHAQNSWVGNVEAANGLASLFSALPVGYLADKWGRDKVLRVGGVLLIGTAGLHSWLMGLIGTDETAPHKHSEIYLAIIMALWGVGGGIVMGPSEALFADSTPKGERSRYYMYLFVCFEIASCMGPLVSIVLFQTLGDDWDLYDLRIIIYVGMAMEALNGFLMMFFDDKKALDEAEEDTQTPNQSTHNTTDDNNSPCNEDTNQLLPDEEQPQSIVNAEDETQVMQNTTTTDYSQQTTPKCQRLIPYILFFHSLIFALGSGMTVKFFPLFFKDQVGMSPTQVQIVYVLVPLVLAGCSGIGQFISSKGGLGRVPTGMLFKTTGVLLLFSMVFFKQYLDQHPLILVPIYILRTALMNASYPLEESILMDNVPKKERARWKSLESISMFGWCGSAAIGGWASDHAHGDYTFTFLITACIQSVGTLTWCLLWPLVKREDEEMESTNTTTFNDATPTILEPTNSDSSEEAFYDAREDPLDFSRHSQAQPQNTLEARYPTLTEKDLTRFQDTFGSSQEELLQKLDEYVEFRDLYDLDSVGPAVDDAEDWRWAAELALQTAKTHNGDMLPGVEGVPKEERICNLEVLPQLCFAHSGEDGSPITSKDGHPIIHYLAGRLDNNNVSPEIHATCIALYLEQKAKQLQLDEDGKSAVLMCDARKGGGWPNHSVLMVAGFLKVLTKTLNKMHPGRLEKLIIYPVPFAGVYAFKMMKRWLPPAVAENIVLVNGSDAIEAAVPKKGLSKYVAETVLDRMEAVRRANFDE